MCNDKFVSLLESGPGLNTNALRTRSKRFSRSIYPLVCATSISHNPKTHGAKATTINHVNAFPLDCTGIISS